MINGFYRIVGTSELVGWASDPSHPNEQVTVEVLVSGAVIGSVIADGMRPDVASSGLGLIKSGFYFKFNDKKIDKEPSIQVRCILKDSPPVLIRKNTGIEEMSSNATIATQKSESLAPVFIVGSPRSGTSALVDALSAAGYSGFREGNFLSLISEIKRVVEKHYDQFHTNNVKVMISHIDKDDLIKKLASTLMEVTNALNPGQLWFDKTGNPAMIRALPLVATLWPTAVFIFAKRRALENVASRIKKFPTQSFEFHCSDWAENMRAWREIKPVLSQDQCLEMEQNEMIYRPKQAATSMATFLGLDDHKKRSIIEVFESNRPQETESGSSSRVLSIETIGWSSAQISTFKENCQSEMNLFGYSMDESYMIK